MYMEALPIGTGGFMLRENPVLRGLERQPGHASDGECNRQQRRQSEGVHSSGNDGLVDAKPGCGHEQIARKQTACSSRLWAP